MARRIALRRPKPDEVIALEEEIAALEARLADGFRQLAVEMRGHFQLSEDDLPQSPVRRRAYSVEALRDR